MYGDIRPHGGNNSKGGIFGKVNYLGGNAPMVEVFPKWYFLKGQIFGGKLPYGGSIFKMVLELLLFFQRSLAEDSAT